MKRRAEVGYLVLFVSGRISLSATLYSKHAYSASGKQNLRARLRARHVLRSPKVCSGRSVRL